MQLRLLGALIRSSWRRTAAPVPRPSPAFRAAARPCPRCRQAARGLGVRIRGARRESFRGFVRGRAQELLALVSDHPHGLAGTFPGSPHAFTAMLAQRTEGQVRWRTWHAYPQEGQLVVTRTRVGVRMPAPVP
ncbi:DUF2617 family protein [Streptomyces sp. M10(2022)]